MVQVQESISGLESLGVSDSEDIGRAQSYIKDANMSRQVCVCVCVCVRACACACVRGCMRVCL